jgi:hypothetical protein
MHAHTVKLSAVNKTENNNSNRDERKNCLQSINNRLSKKINRSEHGSTSLQSQLHRRWRCEIMPELKSKSKRGRGSSGIVLASKGKALSSNLVLPHKLINYKKIQFWLFIRTWI